MDAMERRMAQRTQFMNELYDLVDGSDLQPIRTQKVAERLGFGPEGHTEVQKIARYLEGEYLVKLTGMIGSTICLTHDGVREVEEARSQPDQPTEHFAPISIVYAETITNSAIQQGSPRASQSLTLMSENNLQQVQAFLRSLQDSLSQLELGESEQAELEADIRSLEGQITSPKPKTEVIRPVLLSIKRVLEGTAAEATGAGLITAITSILNNM